MSVPYETRSDWSWPEGAAREPWRPESIHPPGSFGEEEPNVHPEESNAAGANARGSDVPKPQRHYPPRTCRICLEEVQPSFEPMEGVASMFNPAPRVTYVSSDPASGRLIRPCKCRGSQAYVHEGCLQEVSIIGLLIFFVTPLLKCVLLLSCTPKIYLFAPYTPLLLRLTRVGNADRII